MDSLPEIEIKLQNCIPVCLDTPSGFCISSTGLKPISKPLY
nr:MAG TPA: Integrin alpha-V, Integrin beta-3 DOMAIN, PSI, EGF REPEATS [Caudoviricetes sp.]